MEKLKAIRDEYTKELAHKIVGDDLSLSSWERVASDFLENIQRSTAKSILDEVEDIQNPWGLYDTLGKLSEAAKILLHEKDYDGHNWEEIGHCVARAEELQAKLLSLRKTYEVKE